MDRILYISPLSPYPATTGGKQRTKLIFEALSKLAEVDLLLISRWKIDVETREQLERNYRMTAYVRARMTEGTRFHRLYSQAPGIAEYLLESFASRRVYYRVHQAAQKKLQELMSTYRYDLIVARYFHCACRSGAFGFSPLCLDIDDVDWEHYQSRASMTRRNPFLRGLNRWHARTLRTMMDKQLHRASFAWVSKEADRGKISGTPTYLLPNTVDYNSPEENITAPLETGRILFVGALSWPPNQHGLLRFLDTIWPKVLSKCENLRLSIVGAEMPTRLGKLLSTYRNVDVIGFVANLAEAYRNCLFSIVPAYFGAGTHIKIIEALFHGRTCVVTPFGHRGYEVTLRSNESLLVADNADGFASACVALATDASLRCRLAEEGRRRAVLAYGKETFFQRVKLSIDQLQPSRDGVLATAK